MPKSKGGKKVTMSKESAASSYNAANTRSRSTFNTLFSSDPDQCFEEESVYSLLELFPTLDKDIIYDVFIECNRNVSEATEKLLEIVEEESRQHLSEQTDLAMIACSLLSEETTSSKKLTFISGADEWENNLSQSGNIESFVDTRSEITSGSQAGTEQNFNIGVDSFVGVEHSKEDKQTYKDKMVDTQKINNLSFDGMRGKFSSIKPLQSEQGMYGPALDGSRKVPGFMENFKENISDENSGIYGPQNFSSNVGKSEDTMFYQEQSLTSDGQPLVPESMPCGWDKFYQNCLLEPDDVDLEGSSFKRIDISKLVTDTMAKHAQSPSHLSTSKVDPVQAAGGKKKKKKTKTLPSNHVNNSVFNVLSPLGNNLSENLEIGADKSTLQQSKTGTNYFPVNTGTYNHHVMGNLPNADIRKSGITLESEVEYGTSNNLMSPKKLHGSNSKISATAPVFQPKQVDVNRRRNVIEKSSYSDRTQQGSNFDQPRPLIDPVDPLGWKEIFPDTRQPMAAPKPQKLTGGRRNNSTLTTRKPPWVIGAVTVDKSTVVSPGGHTTRQPQNHAAKAPFPQESQQPFWSQPNATLPLQKTFRDFIQTHHWELESESDHSAHLPDWMPHPLQSSRPLVANKAPSFKPPPGFSNLNHQDKVVGHSVQPKLPSDTKPSAGSKHSSTPAAGTPASLEQNVMRNKLSFHGLKSPEDILRRYILEKYPVIVILRGLPGSGKTYLARQLIDLANEMGVEGIILSTDDYFMQRGQYVYNRNDLGTAHEWNQKRALSYVKESRSPIVIDNTNTVMWELLPYAQVAYKYKYDVQVFEPNTPWKSKVRDLARRNSHGVPMDSLKKMKERYEKITTDDVLDAVTAARRNGSLRHNLENQPEVTQVEKVAERTSQPAPLVPPSAVTKTYSTQLSSHSSSSSSFSDTNTSKMSSQSSACDWWEPQGQRTPKQKIQLSSSQKENKNTANSAISQEFLKDSLKQVYVSLLSENINKACTGSLEPWSTIEPTSQIQLEQTGQIQMEPTCQLEPESTGDLKSHLSNKPAGQLGQQSSLKPNTDLKPHSIEDDFSCSDSESSSEEPEKESKLNSSCSTSCSFQSCCSNKEEMVVKYGSADDGEGAAVLSVSENRQNLPEEAGDDLASVETPVTAVEVKEFTFTVKPELKEVKPELKEVKHEFQEAKHQIKEEPELMEENSELKVRKPELKKDKSELKEEKPEVKGAKHEIKEEKPEVVEESGLSEVETSKSENFSSEKVASEDVVNKVDPSTPAVEGPDNVDQCDIGAEGVAGGAKGVASESLVELERKVSALHLVDYSDSESGEDSITLEIKGNLPHEAQDAEVNSECSSVSLTPSSDLKDCEPAQSPLPSSREQSPPSDEKDSLPVKRKKKRVKKGKVTGPFIGESVKAKSKTESWSNFLTPPAKDSVVPKDESGPAVVSERKCAETQCEMYYFSMLHKLNSQAFNKLQPLDLASSEVRVVTLPSSSRWGHVSDAGPDTRALPHTPDTIDRSTNTDETLEKEEIDLETLQSCFPEYSRRQLEDIMAICQNNLEWVTSHLLDSPALTDLVEEETCSGDKHGTVASPLKSLSHMCSSIISQTNVIDKDDLEMQVIQAGHDRLQRIENFARSRIHSWDLAKQHEAWPDQFNLEDFTGLVDPDECWDYGPYQVDPHVNTAPNHNALPARPVNYYEYNYSPSYTKSTPHFTKTDVTKSISKNDIPKSISKNDIETEVETLATDLPYPNKEIRLVEKSNKLYVPLDFLENLEAMYGSLNVDFEEEGLALDDAIARKIYNCLKLQCTKKLKSTSNEQQLQNDEALARALQEEEKLQEVQHSSSQGGKKSVPGWTNQKPAWMCQGAGAGHSDTSSSVFANKHQKIRPLSVADTLNALRGSPGKKLKPFKFQKRMHGSATKSVWSSVKRQGRADSLHSIMEEEKAREEFQKEQLRIIQQTGDTHALATRIKRSELSQLYPSLSPDFLEEVFMNAGYSKEDTMKVLENSYGITAAPLPREVNQEQPWIYNEENVNRYDLDVEEGYESYYSDDSTLNFEEYRNEAQFYRGLAKECQNQAQKYQADNMPGAALFYRQKVKEYKELERSANQKAADVLFDKGTERLAKENTLDLHFYHLDEAVSAVNLAIMLKEDEFKKKQDKKNSFLNIVTGRGRNSKDGVPVLKPAIMNHLRDRGFRFEEKSPGMLKVYIGQRV
ncbi:uncharacterized protein LOC131938977 [Physella acuta]|uniref:uncharacterized protein LOC131938977 n=1 Tax=Physella acuta TaxID=109671 RepID=UPI0027DD0470|nr:uncharacterized protein LOC131938977 [Physella acuta]